MGQKKIIHFINHYKNRQKLSKIPFPIQLFQEVEKVTIATEAGKLSSLCVVILTGNHDQTVKRVVHCRWCMGELVHALAS